MDAVFAVIVRGLNCLKGVGNEVKKDVAQQTADGKGDHDVLQERDARLCVPLTLDKGQEQDAEERGARRHEGAKERRPRRAHRPDPGKEPALGHLFQLASGMRVRMGVTVAVAVVVVDMAVIVVAVIVMSVIVVPVIVPVIVVPVIVTVIVVAVIVAVRVRVGGPRRNFGRRIFVRGSGLRHNFGDHRTVGRFLHGMNPVNISVLLLRLGILVTAVGMVVTGVVMAGVVVGVTGVVMAGVVVGVAGVVVGVAVVVPMVVAVRMRMAVVMLAHHGHHHHHPHRGRDRGGKK